MADTCPYCDGDMPQPTRDHIIPKALGNFGPRNLIPICFSCNQLKGDMTPNAMRMLADDMRRAADRVSMIAARVDAIMVERGLCFGHREERDDSV